MSDPLGLAQARKAAEVGIALARACEGSGSGLAMATHLRDVWREFASRGMNFHPLAQMPVSFRVGELFVEFDVEHSLWRLLPQYEHLLSFNEYLDWQAQSGPTTADVAALTGVLKEDRTYCYSMVNDSQAARISTDDSELVIAGVALVRRGTQVASLLLCGEDPPAASFAGRASSSAPGREMIRRDSNLSDVDRFCHRCHRLGESI